MDCTDLQAKFIRLCPAVAVLGHYTDLGPDANMRHDQQYLCGLGCVLCGFQIFVMAMVQHDPHHH